MAGPAASILLPSPAIVQDVVFFIEDTFQTMDSKNSTAANDPRLAFDGWIEKRPFAILCGLEYAEKFEDMDFDKLCQALSWKPVDEIAFVAMCNTQEDHRLLARICAFAAERFRGIIQFGGKPWLLAEESIAKTPGWLLALRAFDAGEPISEDSADYVCDSTFLKHWMDHPDFRMVK